MAERTPRPWGYWTRAKLDVLQDYLAAFLAASSGKAPHAVYLDAFAGEGSGIDRLTSEEFDGSPRIAAGAVANGSSGYRFSHLRLFELSTTRAAGIQAYLREHFPGRDIDVVPGDCNTTLPATLKIMPEAVRRSPTFAFLDPFGTELKWPTIEAIADHKRGLRYKVELWMLFSAAGLMRIAGSSPAKAALGAEDILIDLFGNTRWEPIVNARRAGTISGADAREAFVNLMRWQLEEALGYHTTHALELKNARGTSIYHMIFATDHPAGDKIVSSLYAKAAEALPEMADEARQHTTGAGRLFSMPSSGRPTPYKHEAPVEPGTFLSSRANEHSP
jgi:three-Cys-motif partner protein